jgi:hypothetical protein
LTVTVRSALAVWAVAVPESATSAVKANVPACPAVGAGPVSKPVELRFQPVGSVLPVARLQA